MELEQPRFQEEQSTIEIFERRNRLTALYDALPEYGSDAFWKCIEETDLQKALPLEVLVRGVRQAARLFDEQGRNRFIEVIIRRTQTSNEGWVHALLNRIPVQLEEHSALANDLLADLYERLIRALLDPRRHFWEEHFLHCLRFERKHVYQSFMTREGRWQNPQEKKSARIPRRLVDSLNQPLKQANGDYIEIDVVDERAELALQAVELSDLPGYLLHLPDRLKVVVLLIFWEGHTEKDVARLLNISDRMVRYRLKQALKILKGELTGYQVPHQRNLRQKRKEA